MNKTILFAKFNTFNKSFAKQLKLSSVFLQHHKKQTFIQKRAQTKSHNSYKTLSTKISKLQCVRLTQFSFLFFFWTRLVSHWWWNSTPSDMCRQSFPNNFALIEITQTLCVPLSRVLFDHIHIIYVCNPTTVKRDLFPSAFVIFLSRPMKSPHGT